MTDLDAIIAAGGPWKRAVRIGDQLLIEGDCREVMAVLPKVDAVVTDPPYGIGLVKKTSDFRDSIHFDKGETLKASRLYDDAPENIAALLKEAVPLAIALAQRALFFSGPAMLWHYPEPASIGSVFTPNGAGRCAWGFQCTHPVLFYGKDPFLQDGMGGRPNSWRTEQPNIEKIDHPCPKPVAWMEWALNRSTRAGEIVLDPFMGSGTTLVACQRLGRQGIGIELDPGYFDIACRRVQEVVDNPPLFHPAPPKPKQEALL